MKNTLKLSNYLFGWFFHKYERYILWISLAISTVLIFVGNLDNKDKYHHIAIEFRTYDLVVDYSGAGFVFLLGLAAIFISIFIQINGFYTNGKGMYSIFTLPMKRSEVFMAFLLSAATAVMLYFAVWLVAMIILYFPITSMYEKAASEAVLYISEEVTIRDLDTSITNGFFLAFERSIFLSTCFPAFSMQAFAVLSGMLLSTVAVIFAGLYNDYISLRVVLFLAVLGGFVVAFYGAWLTFQNNYNYISQGVVLQGLSGTAAALIIGGALLFTAVHKLKRRKDI